MKERRKSIAHCSDKKLAVPFWAAHHRLPKAKHVMHDPT
jgi:hypothetical protein